MRHVLKKYFKKKKRVKIKTFLNKITTIRSILWKLHLMYMIPDKERIWSSSKCSYSVLCMLLFSLSPHAQQLLPSSPSRTFQFPKTKKLRLETSDRNKQFLIEHQMLFFIIHNHQQPAILRNKFDEVTSRSRISSSAFQSGQMRGKDRLSCQNGIAFKQSTVTTMKQNE